MGFSGLSASNCTAVLCGGSVGARLGKPATGALAGSKRRWLIRMCALGWGAVFVEIKDTHSLDISAPVWLVL